VPDLKVVEPQPASALETLVEDYLAHCRARGLSPNTVNQSYRYPLKGILLPFCAREGVTDVSGLTSRTMDKLSAQLLEGGRRDGRPLSKHSVHSYSRTLNHFFSWAKKEGEKVDTKAQLPKLPKKLVEVVSREEIQRMEDAAKTERDKLIVRILADTGLRVGELLGLRTNDLVEQNRNYYLKVRGKGAVDRLVPAPRLYRRLRIYAERGRPRDVVSSRIFLSHRRRPNGDYPAADDLRGRSDDPQSRGDGRHQKARLSASAAPLICNVAALTGNESNSVGTDPRPLVTDNGSGRLQSLIARRRIRGHATHAPRRGGLTGGSPSA
jgi:site-specific recombinase XerD